MSGKKEKQRRRVERLVEIAARGDWNTGSVVDWVNHIETDRARRIQNHRENVRAIAATLGRIDRERA